jgi:hypothetical protein
MSELFIITCVLASYGVAIFITLLCVAIELHVKKEKKDE